MAQPLMNRASLVDFPAIWELVSQVDDSDEMFLKVRETLGHFRYWYWIDPDETIVMAFYPAEGGLWQMHIYTHPKARGRHALRCALNAGCQMVEQFPEAQAFFNIVAKSDRHLRMFMAYTGSRHVATLPNGSLLYVFNADRYQEVCDKLME